MTFLQSHNLRIIDKTENLTNTVSRTAGASPSSCIWCWGDLENKPIFTQKAVPTTFGWVELTDSPCVWHAAWAELEAPPLAFPSWAHLGAKGGRENLHYLGNAGSRGTVIGKGGWALMPTRLDRLRMPEMGSLFPLLEKFCSFRIIPFSFPSKLTYQIIQSPFKALYYSAKEQEWSRWHAPSKTASKSGSLCTSFKICKGCKLTMSFLRVRLALAQLDVEAAQQTPCFLCCVKPVDTPRIKN